MDEPSGQHRRLARRGLRFAGQPLPVVWKRERSIWARFMDDRGEPLGEVFANDLAPNWNDGPPKVACDSSRNRFLVFWSRLLIGGRLMYGRFALGTPDKALISFVGPDHMMVYNPEMQARMAHFAAAFFDYHLRGRDDLAH